MVEAIEAKTVQPVIQINPERHPELKDVPNAIELAKTDEARQLLEVAIHKRSSIIRSLSIAPGSPSDRVKVLQDAFMKTVQDPEFLADAEKAKLDINPRHGAEVKKIVNGFFELDPTILAKLREILVPKG